MNRKTQTLAAMAAAVLMTGVCSCQQGDTERENTMEPWQIQLEQSVSDNIYGEDLSLLGYQYLGQVNTPEQASQIYEEIFGRDSRMPAYRGSFTEFDMESWDEIRGHRCDNINVGFHERRVDSLLKTRPGLVEIEWSYKSRTFKTKALISSRTRRLDYDNVWSHIPVFNKSTEITRRIMPKTKSRTEPSQIGDSIYYTVHEKAECGFGTSLWGAYVDIIMAGVVLNEGGTSSNYVVRKAVNAYTRESSNSYYKALAGIKVLEFSTGTNGYLRVAYGYGVAPIGYGMTLTYHSDIQRYILSNSADGDAIAETYFPERMEDHEIN